MAWSRITHKIRRGAAIKEKELIREILAGNRDLYAEIVERHGTNLYQLCLAVLGDPHEAEEAAQVAFIKAYRGLSSYKGASSFRTWITRIAVNHCKDMIRKKNRRHIFSLEGLQEGGKSIQVVAVDGTQDSPEPLPKVTEGMLGALSEGERRVIQLMLDKGKLSYEQIAGELGLSLDGVKGRLKRARMKLQHFLEEPSSNGG